jgi:ketosteroid isomerase-like protein
MSRENVERVRQSLEAFARRDKPAWAALTHPEAEAIPIGDWPETEIRGRDAVWDFLVSVDEPWEPGQWELTEAVEQGNRVVARQRRDLRGKVSGVEVAYDYWVVFTFDEGLSRRAEWFETRTEALKAAGLSGRRCRRRTSSSSEG